MTQSGTGTHTGWDDPQGGFASVELGKHLHSPQPLGQGPGSTLRHDSTMTEL